MEIVKSTAKPHANGAFMTKIRTRLSPKIHSLTSQQKSMLMLDRFGQINVIIVDDLDIFISTLPIKRSKKISISDVVNANLVYSLAEKIGIKPGIFIEGDVALNEYLYACISDNVIEEDKPTVLAELKESWQRVCSHPLATRYMKLGENTCIDNLGVSPHFTGFGAYEVFMKDYYCGLVNLYCANQLDEMPLFMQLTEIIFSSLSGQLYQGNEFLRNESAIKHFETNMAQVQHMNEAIRQKITKYKETFEAQKSGWFIDVMGWAKFELNDVEKEFPLLCGEALTNLLETRFPLCANHRLNQQLNNLLKYLVCREDEPQPLLENARWQGRHFNATQKRLMARTAVEYAIFEYAKNYNIILYHHAFLHEETPPFQWAGKGEESETLLLSYVLEKENAEKLKPFELYAIMRKSDNAAVREVIQSQIDRRVMSEDMRQMVLSLRKMAIGSCFLTSSCHVMMTLEDPILSPVFTPTYSRLAQTLRGNSTLQDNVRFPLLASVIMPVRKDIQFEFLDKIEEENSDSEEDIFELQESSGKKNTSCIMM